MSFCFTNFHCPTQEWATGTSCQQQPDRLAKRKVPLRASRLMAVCGSFSHRWPGVGPTQRRCLVGGLFFPFPPPSVRGCSSTCTFGANVVSRVLLTTWQQDDELTCLLGVTKICPLHGSRGGPSSLNWWVLFRLIQTMRSMRLVWLSATCLCAPSELVWNCFCRWSKDLWSNYKRWWAYVNQTSFASTDLLWTSCIETTKHELADKEWTPKPIRKVHKH